MYLTVKCYHQTVNLCTYTQSRTHGIFLFFLSTPVLAESSIRSSQCFARGHLMSFSHTEVCVAADTHLCPEEGVKTSLLWCSWFQPHFSICWTEIGVNKKCPLNKVTHLLADLYLWALVLFLLLDTQHLTVHLTAVSQWGFLNTLKACWACSKVLSH